MPEMTDDDVARFRRAVQFRQRCAEAAVANGERLGIPVSIVQARVVFDATEAMIRADERERQAPKPPADTSWIQMEQG